MPRLLGRPLRLPAWAWPLLALPVVALVGVWAYRTIAAGIEKRLESTLRTMVAGDVSALSQFLAAEANLAEMVVADPRVRADVAELLRAVARRTGGDAEALKAAPAQVHLRDLLSPVVSRQDNAGFVVVDPSGLIIARTIDERLGSRLVESVADVAAQALAGHRAFLPPTVKQHFAATPMAFIFVPVPSASGANVAAFAFRIRPEQMAAVLNAANFGGSGDTYAVDSDGRMVTDARFSEQVARLGVLPADAGGRTTAVLEVRDPGTRLQEGQAPPTPPKTWPLTWSAAEAVAGRDGINTTGYRDYRGVDVVGAWRWLPEWRLGVVTEIDRGEAYQTLAVLRRAFAVLTGSLLLVAAAIALASRRIYRLQRQVQKAERLGQYTLEEKIGEGGMGAVYRARHAFLRRPTAVKLIRSDWPSPRCSPASSARSSSRASSRIPTPSPSSTTGARPTAIFYYAMEYLPGLPLDCVVRGDGPLPEARASTSCADLRVAGRGARDLARSPRRQARQHHAVRARAAPTTS